MNSAIRADLPAPEIVRITIDRPHRANALDRATLASLIDHTTTLCADSSTRAVIFTGQDPRWFVSGADIHYLQSISAQEFVEFADLVVQLFRTVRALPSVTIARVTGAAMGIGLVLTLACDVRVAATRAVFGHPEARLGFVGGTALLPRYSSLPALARWRLLTGTHITAEEAMRMGLLTYLVPTEHDVDQVIDDCTDALREIDRDTLTAVKRSIYEAETLPDPASALQAQQGAAAARFDPMAIRRVFARRATQIPGATG